MNRLKRLFGDRSFQLTVFLLLANLLAGYWFYTNYIRARQLQKKTDKFAGLARKYVARSRKTVRNRPGKSSGNLLSYLENKARGDNLAELTPSGKTEDGRQLVRIKLESVRLRKGLALLAELEKEDRVRAREFSVERISVRGKKFDIYFQLVGNS